MTNLSRETAERVMGWTAVRGIADSWSGHPADSGGTEEERRAVPRFAEDMAAAWSVVEEMRRSGYTFQLTYPHPGQSVTARFSREGGVDDIACEARTAPEAICRAALEARVVKRRK